MKAFALIFKFLHGATVMPAWFFTAAMTLVENHP
jgi:hypothetical protein